MSTEFYQTTNVTKARIPRRCSVCGEMIEGPHLKVSVKVDGHFFSEKAHHQCEKDARDMCDDCEDRHDCQGTVADCFHDKVIRRDQ